MRGGPNFGADSQSVASPAPTRVFAERDPSTTAWRGECPQRTLCPNPDLPCASRAAELLDTVGVHGRTGAPVTQIAAAGAKRVGSPAPDIVCVEREGQATRHTGTSGADGLFFPPWTTHSTTGTPPTGTRRCRARPNCLPRWPGVRPILPPGESFRPRSCMRIYALRLSGSRLSGDNGARPSRAVDRLHRRGPGAGPRPSPPL